MGLSPTTAGRAFVTMADQGFASASNFLVGVAVGRITGPAGLGAFALAYACWIAVNNLHRALVTDPMAIHGDAVSPEASVQLQRGVAAEVVLGLAVSVVLCCVGAGLLLVGARTFGVGVLAVAPWIVFLDLQDYWRWVGFMKGQPGKSLANDAVFNIAQAIGFLIVILSGLRSSEAVVAVIGAWGLGATAGSLYGLHQFSVHPSIRGGVAMLRERWHMSKWLAGNSLTSSGAAQVVVLIVGAMLGPASLGGLKAAQALAIGPLSVVINGSGSIGLPEAQRELKQRGWPGLRQVALLVSAAAFLSAIVWGAVIVLVGHDLLRDVYGPKFAQYGPAASIVAIALLMPTLGLGLTISLKAMKQTRSVFKVQVIGLFVVVPSVVILAYAFGVTGAALGLLLSNIVTFACVAAFTRTARRSLLAGTLQPTSDDEAPLLGLAP
jgi:O-antigen/teichoic acid export membrane protein